MYPPLSNSKQFFLEGFEPLSPFPVVKDEKLPTNITANRHSIHRWFNFVAGFAPEFVARHCPSGTDSFVLDPFAGCGTTLVVAQTLGNRAIGFEPHPFFARIARAKIGGYPSMSRLHLIESILLEGIQSPCPISSLPRPAETFLRKLFDEPVIEQLLGARELLCAAGLSDDDLAFLVLSRALDMCSKAKIDGIYKAPTSTKTAAIPIDAIKLVMREVRFDLSGTSRPEDLCSATVCSTSSEDMGHVESGTIDSVITSPPYLNNFDFAEMTRMYLYFWGMCGSWQEITDKVRSKLVVNTTTSLKGHRELQLEYRAEIALGVLSELDAIVGKLNQLRDFRAGKKEYYLLVFPYFAQMTRILIETLRCLREDAEAHIVVADSALYGVHISTPQILAAIMSEIGYKSVTCRKLRDRGQRWVLEKREGSPIGLGEFHLSGTRRDEG